MYAVPAMAQKDPYSFIKVLGKILLNHSKQQINQLPAKCGHKGAWQAKKERVGRVECRDYFSSIWKHFAGISVCLNHDQCICDVSVSINYCQQIVSCFVTSRGRRL